MTKYAFCMFFLLGMDLLYLQMSNNLIILLSSQKPSDASVGRLKKTNSYKMRTA